MQIAACLDQQEVSCCCFVDYVLIHLRLCFPLGKTHTHTHKRTHAERVMIRARNVDRERMAWRVKKTMLIMTKMLSTSNQPLARVYTLMRTICAGEHYSWRIMSEAQPEG